MKTPNWSLLTTDLFENFVQEFYSGLLITGCKYTAFSMCLNLAEATQGLVLALSLGLRDLWSSGPVTRTKSNGFVWRRAPAEVLLMHTEDAAKSQAGKKIKGKDYFSYH